MLRLFTDGVVVSGQRLRVSRDFETLGDLKLAYCRVDELERSRVSIQVDDPDATPRLLVFDGDGDVVRALQACCDHARNQLVSRRAAAFDQWLLDEPDDRASYDTLESSDAHFDRSALLQCSQELRHDAKSESTLAALTAT